MTNNEIAFFNFMDKLRIKLEIYYRMREDIIREIAKDPGYENKLSDYEKIILHDPSMQLFFENLELQKNFENEIIENVTKLLQSERKYYIDRLLARFNLVNNISDEFEIININNWIYSTIPEIKDEFISFLKSLLDLKSNRSIIEEKLSYKETALKYWYLHNAYPETYPELIENKNAGEIAKVHGGITVKTAAKGLYDEWNVIRKDVNRTSSSMVPKINKVIDLLTSFPEAKTLALKDITANRIRKFKNN